MSDRNNSVEWIETTEEVIITEECLSTDANAVISVLEPAEAPIQKLLGAVVQGESSDADDVFCCEECLTLFQDQTDPSNISGPSFVLDYPTAAGVPQRALLTLPYGLTIGRSSIPTAGIGVINHGPTVSPGMHFGPYEGEMTIRENAMASDFSWEIFKGQDEYEYIDAARDTHSNWMRYVNCARNKDETNLLAVQYKGSILFHCCRIIHQGDELMVWPSSNFFSQFSEAWRQIWIMKLNTRESSTTASTQIFLCSHCQLSFTTESYLQRHTEYFHLQPPGGTVTKQVEANEHENPSLNASASVMVFSVDPVDSKTCSDCGKTFKQMPHLRRHKLCVHSNKRPYCCPHCRRSFSQASGLIRHQLVHKKQNLITDTDTVPNQDKILGEKENSSLQSDSVDPSIMKDLTEAKEVNLSQSQKETLDVNETENTSGEEVEASQGSEGQPHSCSDCGKGFATITYLKKHKMSVHSKLRPYVCTLCKKCFGQYNDLSRHLQCHKNESINKEGATQNADDSTISAFCCTECSLTFPSVDDLQEHFSECHSVVIPVENQEEDSTDDGQTHGPDSSQLNSSQPPEPETAESSLKPASERPQRLGAGSKLSAITKLIAPKQRRVIGKNSLTSSGLAERDCTEPEVPHVRTRKSAKFKWYSCGRCKRTYTNPGDLKTHNCAFKKHKCGQCGATFNKTGFLRRHEQTVHGNTKSYSCDRCGRVFSTSGNLKQHQKSKTCERYHCASELFSCSFCQFSFTMKNYLIKHVKRHHPLEYVSHCESEGVAYQQEEDDGGKEYLCSHCGKSYASAKALKAHACFQQVKILYLCTDCGKGFSNHYGLKQHQRIHTGEKPFNCPHCSKSFSYTGQLNVHLRTHTGEKPYLCTHCGESFRQSGDLKRHERKHTGVRPYSCPECCKSFSRPQSLKAHQMLHLGQKMFKCTQCGKSFSRNYHLRRHHQKMHL